MKRLLKILVVIILLSVVGYVSYWYMIANQARTQLVELLDQLHEKTDDTNNIHYKSVGMGGFPLKVALKIEGVSATISNERLNHKMELNTKEPVILSMPINGGSVKATLPSYQLTLHIKHEKNLFNIDYPASNPTLDLHAANMNMIDLLSKETSFNIQDFWQNFTSAQYASKGLTVSTEEDGIIYSEGDNNHLITKKEENGNFLVHYTGTSKNIKTHSAKKIARWAFPILLPSYIQEYGSMDSDSKLSLQIPKGNFNPLMSSIAINIEQLAIKNDVFAVNVEGNIEKAAMAMIPSGNITLSLKEYDKAIEWVVNAMENPYEYGNDLALKLNDQDRASILKFMRMISDEPTSDSTDLTITATSKIDEETGSPIMTIGTKTAEEVEAMARDTFKNRE